MGKKEKSNSTIEEPAIPARIVVGVTGHRELDNQLKFSEAVQSAFSSIRKIVTPLEKTPLLLYILSPLAEGADRLVAQEALQIPGAVLEAVLPMKKDDYMTDFNTEDSRQEFQMLLSQAVNIKTLPSTCSRVEAYEQVGRYIVDQCDVLIAIWDGNSAAGRGGTQEMVRYARNNCCPLIWIHAKNPSAINIEMGHGIRVERFTGIDKYNSEKVDIAGIEFNYRRYEDVFIRQANYAGLPLEKFRLILEYFLGYYIRGDILALQYQHFYYRAQMLVYLFALAAVIIAAFQILFKPDLPIILISEIVLMAAVLGIVWAGKYFQWHEKWIDYRFLTERFRSAIFMSVTGMEVTMMRPPRHLTLAYEQKSWIVGAFTAVWSGRPRRKIMEPSTFEKVRNFLSEAWLEDQIRFHAGTEKRHRRRYRLMNNVSYFLFGLTIVVAILHIADIGSNVLATVFAFMAVVLPAVAASISAIRTHREYLRNSMRSAEMVRHLKELKGQMTGVRNEHAFLELVKETEETMLHENEDWRIVVRFHKIEPV